MSSNPQQQAANVLVETFKPHHAFGPADPCDHSTLVVFQEEDGSSMRALTFGEIVDCLAEAGLLVTPQASSAERSEEDEGRYAPTPSAGSAPVVSYDSLVDWVTRLEVTVKPVNGVVTVMAESMADAFADFLGASGIEVRRDGL